MSIAPKGAPQLPKGGVFVDPSPRNNQLSRSNGMILIMQAKKQQQSNSTSNDFLA